MLQRNSNNNDHETITFSYYNVFFLALVASSQTSLAEAGILYVVSTGTNQVLRYNDSTGAFIDAFVSAGSGGLDPPVDLVMRPGGNLYVASFATNQVLLFNGSTGAFIDAFVSTGSGGLNSPLIFFFCSDGKL